MRHYVQIISRNFNEDSMMKETMTMTSVSEETMTGVSETMTSVSETMSSVSETMSVESMAEAKMSSTENGTMSKRSGMGYMSDSGSMSNWSSMGNWSNRGSIRTCNDCGSRSTVGGSWFICVYNGSESMTISNIVDSSCSSVDVMKRI